MRITPRRDEVAVVVEILESDDYGSSDAMAKDLIKAVAEILSGRETTIVAERMGERVPPLLSGPFWHAGDVKTWTRNHPLTDRSELGAFRVMPPADWSGLATEQGRPPVCGCGHRKEMHPKGNCAVIDKQKTRCPCKGYKQTGGEQ